MNINPKWVPIVGSVIMLFAPVVVSAGTFDFGTDGKTTDYNCPPSRIGPDVHIDKITVIDGERVNNLNIHWSNHTESGWLAHKVENGSVPHDFVFEGNDRLVRMDVFWKPGNHGGIHKIVFWHSGLKEKRDVAGGGKHHEHKEHFDDALKDLPAESAQRSSEEIKDICVMSSGDVLNRLKITTAP